MNPNTPIQLSFSFGVSKKTGYNICRLKDLETGKIYKIDGGGFDMKAFVFAEWAGDVFRENFKQAQEQGKKLPSFIEKDGRVDASSVAGIDEVEKALEAIDFHTEIKRNFNGSVIGFVIKSFPKPHLSDGEDGLSHPEDSMSL